MVLISIPWFTHCNLQRLSWTWSALLQQSHIFHLSFFFCETVALLCKWLQLAISPPRQLNKTNQWGKCSVWRVRLAGDETDSSNFNVSAEIHVLRGALFSGTLITWFQIQGLGGLCLNGLEEPGEGALMSAATRRSRTSECSRAATRHFLHIWRSGSERWKGLLDQRPAESSFNGFPAKHVFDYFKLSVFPTTRTCKPVYLEIVVRCAMENYPISLI